MKMATSLSTSFIAQLKAQLGLSSSSSRDQYLTKIIRAKATGLHLGQTKKPDSQLPPVSGSIDSLQRRGPLSQPARVRPTVAFTRWKVIQQDAWACRIIWVGTGNPHRAFRYSAFQD